MIRIRSLMHLTVTLILAAGWATVAQAASPEFPKQHQPGYSVSIDVPVMNLDVVVTDDEGRFLTELGGGNFRVSEDGVVQKIAGFSATEAPITTVLLLEYSQIGGGWFLANATSGAEQFLRELQPKDWVALSTFSMRPKVEVDFTHSTGEIRAALAAMGSPTFHESNLFDSVIDTLDRLSRVKGRKSILILASGMDTFSQANFDDVLNRLRSTDVTIYTVGVGEQLFLSAEMSGGITSADYLQYIQAKNQLRAFTELTGGRAWFPRFETEIPGIMADVAARLRNSYSIAYTPSNRNFDGRYRKVRVDILDQNGQPMKVFDDNGKKREFAVYVREGYLATKEAAGTK